MLDDGVLYLQRPGGGPGTLDVAAPGRARPWRERETLEAAQHAAWLAQQPRRRIALADLHDHPRYALTPREARR